MSKLFPPEDQGLESDLAMHRRARAKRKKQQREGPPRCEHCNRTDVSFSIFGSIADHATGKGPLLCVECEKAAKALAKTARALERKQREADGRGFE